MDNKFFGIGPTYRSTIPDAKRATGFGATQEPFEYINQALFELKTDHIIGTAAQLAVGSCTCKYQSSDQTLRDSSGTEVTLTDGDRVYIIGLDTLTADFDLSAYDRLAVISDKSAALSNSSYDLVFGDECFIDVKVSSYTGITVGTLPRGMINGKSFDCPAGTIKSIGSSSVPAGWKECNGANLSRTDYVDLFKVIGTNFGQGDGSTTFTIPDIRGRFLRGWDHGVGRDPVAAARTAHASGGATGDSVGSVQDEDTKNHNHQWYTDSTGSGNRITTTATGSAADTLFNSSGANTVIPTGVLTGDYYTELDIASFASDTSETRPVNANVMYMIRV